MAFKDLEKTPSTKNFVNFNYPTGVHLLKFKDINKSGGWIEFILEDEEKRLFKLSSWLQTDKLIVKSYKSFVFIIEHLIKPKASEEWKVKWDALLNTMPEEEDIPNLIALAKELKDIVITIPIYNYESNMGKIVTTILSHNHKTADGKWEVQWEPDMSVTQLKNILDTYIQKRELNPDLYVLPEPEEGIDISGEDDGDLPF